MARKEITRRAFGGGVLAAGLGGMWASSAARGGTPSTSPATTRAAKEDLVWSDVRDWGVEGRGFSDTAAYFDRLPARAEALVRKEVWNLSHHAAGMTVRFETDSPVIAVKYELTSDSLAMPHMPATGVSGVDLYGMLNGTWHWAATASPKAPTIETTLLKDAEPGHRQYLLHLPLYNGVKRLQIGVTPAARFQGTPPRTETPILFYGTSITQGACASRPGMSFVNILGRRLNRPVLNFGFSGNGRTELEVAELLAEIPAAVFVLDCIANTSPEQITERTVPLARLLRQRQPSLPILLVEDRTWSSAPLSPALRVTHTAKRAALSAAFRELTQSGTPLLTYIPGDPLLGNDTEATTDGSHPNDLGMMRYADALEAPIKAQLAAG